MSAYLHTKTGLLFVVEYEDDGPWAWVPEMPGCASQGDTLSELFANIGEAIEGCLEVMVDEGMLLPTESMDCTGTP